MMKCFLLAILTCLSVSVTQDIVFKDRVVTMKCTGISFMGSGITIDDAKKFAVNDAKRNALERAGTYLASRIILKDHTVTEDEIETYTAGILKTEIVSAVNKLVEGTFAVEVVIEAKIDTKFLEDRLNRVPNDAQLRKMLEEQKKLNDKLTKEISDLRKTKTGKAERSRDIARSLEAADWFDKGFKSQEAGKYIDALVHYGKAIQLDPEIAQIYNNRGLVYYFMDDFANAESNFDKALELDPGLAMAYNNKAVLSYERRDFTGAIAYFNQVLSLDPKLEQTYFNRAFAYHKIGSSELCIKDLEEYLRLAGNKNGDENRIKNFIKDLKEPKPVEAEPVYCKVPDLYYLSPCTAEKKLKEAGLMLGVTYRITDIDKGFDRVIGQSVPAGNELEAGSAVDITVNVEAEDEGW